MQDQLDNLMRWIRRRRLALGMTQTALAGAVNLPLATVNGWETGRRRPKPRNIPLLATALRSAPEDIADRIVAAEK